MIGSRFWKGMACVIVAACSAVFFATSLTVYAAAKPNSVSELLLRDETWLNTNELSVRNDDLEKYPYVTKVYDRFTDGEKLTVRYCKRINDIDMTYGIVEDSALSSNYRVECFVYSDIADKKLVARLWNIAVQEGEELTLMPTDSFNVACDAAGFNDLKKRYSQTPRYYTTFMRISAKPGMTDISFFNDMYDPK